jgi:hypothetical protein
MCQIGMKDAKCHFDTLHCMEMFREPTQLAKGIVVGFETEIYILNNKNATVKTEGAMS